MTRGQLGSLAAGLLVFSSGISFAEEVSGPIYEGRLLRRHEEQTRKAKSDELRFERARYRARQRIAREEMYERMGYSPLRPYTPIWTIGAPRQSVPYDNFSVWYGYGR